MIAAGAALAGLAPLLLANAAASEARDHWGAFALRLPLYAALALGTTAIAIGARAPLVEAFALATVLVAALCVIETDMRWFVIPDLAVLAIFTAALLRPAEWSEIALGAGLTGGMMLVVRYGFLWLRGVEGLGWGDVKFAVAMGAWLGPHLALSAVAAATGATAMFLIYRLLRGGEVERLAGRPAAPLGVGLAAATIGASCLRLTGWV